MTTDGIPLPYLHTVWHQLWPMLEPAVKRMKTPPNVLALLLSHDAQLWMIHENEQPIAGVVTQITWTEGRKRCFVMLIGGSRAKEWLGDFIAKIEAWARSLDCVALWASGRTGWDRLLKKYGCVPVAPIDGYATWEKEFA